MIFRAKRQAGDRPHLEIWGRNRSERWSCRNTKNKLEEFFLIAVVATIIGELSRTCIGMFQTVWFTPFSIPTWWSLSCFGSFWHSVWRDQQPILAAGKQVFRSGRAANSAWAKASSRTEKETLRSANKSNHTNCLPFFFWSFSKCKLELIFVLLNSSPQCSRCLWCKLLLVWHYWLVFRALWSAGALETGQSRGPPDKFFIQLFSLCVPPFLSFCFSFESQTLKGFSSCFFSLWHYTQGQMVAGKAAFFRFLLSIFYAGRWRKWVQGFQKHKLLHKHLMFWLSPGGEKEEKSFHLRQRKIWVWGFESQFSL